MILRLPVLVAALLIACAASAADLGRMFFTPAQRATLDSARKQNIRVEFSDETADQPAAAPPVPQNISVNGMIRRSDGKDTIWINNRPVTDQNAGGFRVSPQKGSDRVHLSVPESGRSVDLKVGQSVEIVSGTIEENYSRRAAVKSEVKGAPGTEPAPGASDKQAPTAQAPAGDSAQKKREIRNRESDLLYDMQRLNDAQSK